MITTNETEKLKICGRGLNAGRSPPHPPSKEAAILDHARKGLEKYFKGGTVVQRREGFLGGSEAPRFFASPQHTPDQLIPLHISLTPLISCPKVGTFGYQDHREKRYSTSMTSHRLSIPEAE